MLKSLISQSEQIFAHYKQNGIEYFRNINKEASFNSILETSQKFTKNLMEQRLEIKLDSFFKYKINAFLPLNENEDFNIGMFFLPKGHEIPLHDHPEMIVVSKIIEGRLEFLSIDFFNEKIQKELPKKLYYSSSNVELGSEIFQANIISRSILKTNDLLYLTPFTGNMHSFKAIEDSIILDILIPRYDMINRFCNFYKILNESGISADLQYVFPPLDYECININF